VEQNTTLSAGVDAPHAPPRCAGVGPSINHGKRGKRDVKHPPLSAATATLPTSRNPCARRVDDEVKEDVNDSSIPRKKVDNPEQPPTPENNKRYRNNNNNNPMESKNKESLRGGAHPAADTLALLLSSSSPGTKRTKIGGKEEVKEELGERRAWGEKIKEEEKELGEGATYSHTIWKYKNLVPMKEVRIPPGAHFCDIEGCERIGHSFADADDIDGGGHLCKAHYPSCVCSVEGCWEKGVKVVEPSDVPGERGRYFCAQHAKKHCVVKHCPFIGRKKIPKDHLGPKGYRCGRHGAFKKCVFPGCELNGKYITKDTCEVQGLACLVHSGRPCSVPGCNRGGVVTILNEDRFGAPGRRCEMHGKVCSVFNCWRVGNRRREKDAMGAEGYRCLQHGGGYECVIPGCFSIAKMRYPTADANGSAGYRCHLHGRKCNVRVCNRVGRRKRPADALGPAGYRCGNHGGGHPCSVPDCQNAAYMLASHDHRGPAGYRCTTHGNHRNVPGCGATPKAKI